MQCVPLTGGFSSTQRKKYFITVYPNKNCENKEKTMMDVLKQLNEEKLVQKRISKNNITYYINKRNSNIFRELKKKNGKFKKKIKKAKKEMDKIQNQQKQILSRHPRRNKKSMS